MAILSPYKTLDEARLIAVAIAFGWIPNEIRENITMTAETFGTYSLQSLYAATVSVFIISWCISYYLAIFNEIEILNDYVDRRVYPGVDRAKVFVQAVFFGVLFGLISSYYMKTLDFLVLATVLSAINVVGNVWVRRGADTMARKAAALSNTSPTTGPVIDYYLRRNHVVNAIFAFCGFCVSLLLCMLQTKLTQVPAALLPFVVISPAMGL